ncbi:cytochrome P450 18a1-like [Stegodyphus dumicola]|uniref:cytochrome P450 18a1-like n=1 Tax=Stegodyphus dumicola TaxID=202533 RepID=UPI0015AC0890|nr:cytochrome P450 18a1-like [Stegodyphus dumicola]
METAALIFITALIAFVALFLSWKKKGQNLPPGPIGLPFVGYIPFLTNKPYVKLQELAKIYGPVYRIQMGSKPVVVLCDFQTIKNAFANDDFMGRPPDFFNDLSEDTLRTGAFLDLPWKEQRRFCLHMLRDLGFGKTRMEELLKEEILEFLQCIEDYHGSPVKLAELLTSSTSNNIAALIFGRVLKLSDPKRQKLDNELNEVGRIAGALFWQIFFPWIAAVMTFFNLGDKGKLSRALAEVKKYCREEMEDHEKTLDPNNIRDFVDGYLLEIKKKADEPNTTFKRGVLPDIARGFFGAGSETVRLSVEWTMLVCAAFPEVQMKIQQEIDDVIGQERFPTRTDHLQMPYTEAVILELGRWKTILPLNIMRRTLKDTELNGYFIPKNTHILAVIWAVHHDKKLWGNDTDVFRPERFLSEDGKKVIKPEYYIPFSIGKRACPGKSFAEVEVFLYVTALLQKFNVSMPPGTRPDLEGILGIGLQPKRLELILKLRKR